MMAQNGVRIQKAADSLRHSQDASEQLYTREVELVEEMTRESIKGGKVRTGILDALLSLNERENQRVAVPASVLTLA
ncbi:hypothetical protein CHU32_03785 [Superficieibacter electus]|uniref:Uncharacterized protein n=1 Tax=Superficieibacter electus TaxID=2022662 RepID=A0A2P5GVH4_9ENTR|nr:hypothetical protein [Superficieibacter electus]POP42365.1 hypothetical protein CHU33_20070 [Superficieibacter electus]POP50554.1 hypothetical protein CHU32_03785 [Superficieibacter electus]